MVKLLLYLHHLKDQFLLIQIQCHISTLLTMEAYQGKRIHNLREQFLDSSLGLAEFLNHSLELKMVFDS